MALPPILRYPDPRLHTRAGCRSVKWTTKSAALIADMAETMYEAPGIGLAATQVTVHKGWQSSTSEDKSALLALDQPPEIIARSGEQVARKAFVCRCPASTTR